MGAVLRSCADAACAVVPFGGGTSVVGGVSALRGANRAVLALDLRRLDRGNAVDPVAMTATLQAGMTGPQVEAYLGSHGLTLGHFPQSFEFATIGGFAATRSAGQASSGYGRFDEMVEGLRMVAPSGDVVAGHPATPPAPRSASCARVGGPPRGHHRGDGAGAPPTRPAALRGLVVPHFGTAWLRCARSPRAASPPTSFASATTKRRGWAWRWHGQRRRTEALGQRYLRLRGPGRGCVRVTGWDSDALLSGARQSEDALIRRHHGDPARRVARAGLAPSALPRPVPARRAA